MATRRTSTPNKSAAKSGGKPAGAKKTAAAGTKVAAAKKAAGKGKRPVKAVSAKPGLPWGVIATVTAVAVFCVGIIGYAAWKSNSDNKHKTSADQKIQKQIDAASKKRPEPHIQGVAAKQFTSQQHQSGVLKYDDSPPFGGPHNPNWADCMGTIYPQAIANENAVHTLEHGAVWVTYKPDLPAAEVTKLKKMVAGQPYMLMSPYPQLDKPISLQAWGHQLKVDNASDARVKQFIDGYRRNPQYTPEMGGTCSQPQFKQQPSSQGSPWEPSQ
jgi:Protein of unknown function (DUF3105)